MACTVGLCQDPADHSQGVQFALRSAAVDALGLIAAIGVVVGVPLAYLTWRSQRGRRRLEYVVTTNAELLPEHLAASASYDERDWDLYTLWYWQLAGRGVEEGRVEVGRVETLREDFIAFLERHRVPVGDAFLGAVRDMPAANTSDRGEYRGYYDDRLRDLVAHKARLIVDRYGYEF
jgi:hypothetical protein